MGSPGRKDTAKRRYEALMFWLYRCRKITSGSELVNQAALGLPALLCLISDEDPELRALKLASRPEIAGPMQEPEKASPFLPDKLQKFSGADGVRLAAGIRLNAPAQVIAPPGAQAMSARRTPKEPDRASHCHRTPAPV